VLTDLATSCMYYVGSLFAAWVTFGTRNYESSWSWRIPSFLQIAIPAVAIIGILYALHETNPNNSIQKLTPSSFCPESPRWLINTGKIEEARAILVEYHAGGDLNSRLVTYEMTEMEYVSDSIICGWKTAYNDTGSEDRTWHF